jgi:hypothetical protein
MGVLKAITSKGVVLEKIVNLSNRSSSSEGERNRGRDASIVAFFQSYRPLTTEA